MRPDGFFPWEVTIDTTKVALLRFMEAMLFKTVLVDKSTLEGLPSEWYLGRGMSAKIQVQIHNDQLNDFVRIAQPTDVRAPPRYPTGWVDIGGGHPGKTKEFIDGKFVTRKKRW